MNQVSSCFSCFAERCNFVLLRSSRNASWITELLLTLHHHSGERITTTFTGFGSDKTCWLSADNTSGGKLRSFGANEQTREHLFVSKSNSCSKQKQTIWISRHDITFCFHCYEQPCCFLSPPSVAATNVSPLIIYTNVCIDSDTSFQHWELHFPYFWINVFDQRDVPSICPASIFRPIFQNILHHRRRLNESASGTETIYCVRTSWTGPEWLFDGGGGRRLSSAAEEFKECRHENKRLFNVAVVVHEIQTFEMSDGRRRNV